MRSAATLLVLCFLLSAAGAPAQGVSVSYLEGNAGVGGGTAWRELSIGDPVPADAILRVEEHAYLELVIDQSILRQRCGWSGDVSDRPIDSQAAVRLVG
jgi:hypothetical protein